MSRRGAGHPARLTRTYPVAVGAYLAAQSITAYGPNDHPPLPAFAEKPTMPMLNGTVLVVTAGSLSSGASGSLA
ncbi:MAG: hypothetical protein AAGD12_14375 [Pseudomonadota bacterium]